jgi:predicted nucleic acid-binding protein
MNRVIFAVYVPRHPRPSHCADRPRSRQTLAALLAARKHKWTSRGDVLIASVALAEKATLITRNVGNFSLLLGLMSENWAD